HGLDIQIIKKNWLKKIIAKKILKRAHLVTANSEFTKKLIKELSPSVNCLVIYPAANELPKAEKTAQEQLSTQYQLTDKPILLSVSRLVKRKGQDLIIKSLPKLWQKFPNLIYVCIGSGPEQNQLQNLTTQTPRSNQIIFLNQVTDQELTNWYSLATLFVLPVYQDINDPEGFGMVYLEANSFGLPVIGSQTGGIPEAINNGYSGLLIKPGDASELTKSIDLLLSNEDLFKKIQQQAPLWAKKFNWTQGATLFYSALNRL
ncbi:MAG: glycosyltransferase, partial [Candidatus Komeilibacteria bacterium]|nr:glycosyltransferase [Candidatus Komeilibacteria bacterium]